MNLIKIKDGLIEQDNYFTTSPSSDFLGENQYSRTANTFVLKEGYIERPFPYEEYVIIVEKEQDVLKPDDELKMYIRKNHLKSGIIETLGTDRIGAKYWKMVRYNQYVQAYSSDSNGDWVSVGGGGIMPLQSVQGFALNNTETSLTIKDYRVYRSPYITIMGLNVNNVGELVDEYNNIIDEKIVDGSGDLDLFLENVVNARLVVYSDSTKSEIVYESAQMEFKFGDIYNLVSHELALFYKGVILGENPTNLDSTIEVTTLKNLSELETYSNILIATTTENTDEITLSFDNVSFLDELTVEALQPSEEVDIYIKITKDPSIHSFRKREFDMIIDVI